MSEYAGKVDEGLERVVAVMPYVLRKKGLLGFRQESYTLVMTESRLLFAQMTKQLQKKQSDELSKLSQENQKAGRGFFASWGDSIAAGLTWYDRYLAMEPETILKETATNFALSKKEIDSVTSNTGVRSNNNDSRNSLPDLIFKTKNGKEKFLLARGYDPVKLKNLINWVGQS